MALYVVIKSGEDPHTAEAVAAFSGENVARAALCQWLDDLLVEPVPEPEPILLPPEPRQPPEEGG